MQVHPETPVTAVCRWTLKGEPGKFEGIAVWQSSNPKDVITQVDDPDNGISTATIDGTANVLGDSSVFSCSADVAKGDTVEILGATSEQVEWTPAVEMLADGVEIAMSQPGPLSQSGESGHRAAQAAAGDRPAAPRGDDDSV